MNRQALKKYCKRSKVNRYDLAAALGISYGNIGSILCGNVRFSFEHIKIITEMLDLTLSEFNEVWDINIKPDPGDDK